MGVDCSMKHVPGILRWSIAIAFIWVIPLAQIAALATKKGGKH
jgi:hypothetical protein